MAPADITLRGAAHASDPVSAVVSALDDTHSKTVDAARELSVPRWRIL